MPQKSKLTIGILGGMGPDATADIFKRIIDLTPAKKDSEHIRILVDNNPFVPSRVDAILKNTKSPVNALKSMADGLVNIGADFLVMPCNTASYFIDDLRDVIKVPILDIVSETVNHVHKKYPQVRKIGILGTTAAIKIGLYQKKFMENEIEILCHDDHCTVVDNFVKKFSERYYRVGIVEKDDDNITTDALNTPPRETVYTLVSPTETDMNTLVQKGISGREGVKAGNISHAKGLFKAAISELKEDGVEVIVMGCTEIPLAITQKDVSDVILVDPTQVLAQTAVDVAIGISDFTEFL